MIYPLILSGILLHITDGAGIQTMNIRVKSRSPGIIPCLYDKKHKENRKYWCKGSHLVSCSILAYANETGKYSLTDYPAQSIFTVQWKNMKTSDTGYYWCAVEIGGKRDAGYYLYLRVQSTPDVSVVSSSVSGHEGGDISVQCFYSSGYKNEVKQWCRYEDKSCYTVERTNTSQISSVQISDDGRRSYTVLMTGLRLTDSGWYFCSVGDLQVPVQLTVTEAKRAFTTAPVATPSHSETDMHTTQPSTNMNPTTMTSDSRPVTDVHDVILVMFLPAMLVLLLLVAIVTWRLRKKPVFGKEHIHPKLISYQYHPNLCLCLMQMHCDNQMTSNSPAEASASVDDSSVIYSSVITFCKAPSSSVNSEAEVIYSSVKKTPKT
ncbi:CMRF35-like molecule 1, partial [Sinocyclocheilus grahami]|uniref:CMRF35-like molecule 1 n=1 Tax=Sinocyclocheilus grahami TaxID=75366 RepID=UPI0007AC73F5